MSPQRHQHPRPASQDGAALVIALIMLSGITLLVVSYFAVATSEIQSSSRYADSYRARLAAESAFEEAKDILLGLTANDSYIVHSITSANGMVDRAGEPLSSRYTFITEEDGRSVKHIPLWAGGEVKGTRDISDLDSADYRPAPGMASGFFFDPDPSVSTLAVNEVRTLWSTYLTSQGGDSEASESAPLTGWLKADGADISEDLRMRYTFWIEVVQGYLDLENHGTWTDHYEAGDGFARDFVNYGYTSLDVRADPNLGEGNPSVEVSSTQSPGGRFAIQGSPDLRYGYQFPRIFRGQEALGQIAPGLCPREVHLAALPAAVPGGAVAFNRGILAEYGSQGSWLIGNYSASMLPENPTNRFRVGTRPYRERPMIPRGFGYPSEGEPRTNLNALLSEPDPVRAISDAIRDELPGFESRAGEFPEDYLPTLAANMIDYVDEDGLPTFDQPLGGGGAASYRGVDNYPFINEIFIQLVYGGYETVPENVPDGVPPEKFVVHFSVIPSIELWNPSNRPVQIADLQLDARFAEGFGFEGPELTGTPTFYDLGGPEGDGGDGVMLVEDQLADETVSIVMAPNEYLVVGGLVEDGGEQPAAGSFGLRHFVAEVENPEGALEFELTKVFSEAVATAPGFAAEDGRLAFSLTHAPSGAVLDKGSMVFVHLDASAPPSAFPDDMKITGEDVFEPSDGAIRCANPGLAIGDGASAATNWGDPRMGYYVAADGTNPERVLAPVEYVAQSTPGGRNSRRDEGGAGVSILDQQRIYHSPDGGYSTPRGPRPLAGDEPQLPLAAAALAFPAEPTAAPSRISNLGQFYSVTELGHIYDPVMWRPADAAGDSTFGVYMDAGDEPESWELSYASGSDPDGAWGGFNTLRIGRPEHPIFEDQDSAASSLLDIFHTGTTGTNLRFVDPGGDHDYAEYDPRDHQWPPAAPDEDEASELPYRFVYPANPDTGEFDLHAQGPYRWIYGHLNINSAPDVETIQALVAGLYSADNISAASDGGSIPLNGEGDPEFRQVIVNEELLVRGGGTGSRAIAERLMELRPFYAPSQLARAFPDDAAPVELERPSHDFDQDGDNNIVSDAVREEAFARLLNLTTFSSRHFRIYTYGQTLSRSGNPIAGAGRVYEVFFRPVRNEDGEIESVKCEVLSERDL